MRRTPNTSSRVREGGVVRSAIHNRAFVVAAALLLGSGAGLSAAINGLRWYTSKLEIHGAYTCSSVSAHTDSWERIGQDRLMSSEVLETLGTTNYVQRALIERHPAEGKHAREVDFHLAYYTGGVDTVPHVPDRCFVAGGEVMTGGPFVIRVPLKGADWIEDTAASADTRRALGTPDAKVLSAKLGPTARAPGKNRVRLPRGIDHLDLRVFAFAHPGSSEPVYAGYFFIANGGLTSSAQNVRLLAFDLKSDYAYYMKVQFTATHLKGPEELAEIAGSVLDDLLPEIMECVPDWTEVIRGEYPADNPRRVRKGE